jgi:CubicO group peptidase (beta-lactamase class C family)
LEYVLESKFQYSEIGYTVLGHMVEKLKNSTIKDAIFQVLTLAGLRDTGYAPTTPKDQIVPGGYNNGTCRGIPFNKYAKFMNNMAGNSGLFSTVDNIMTYMQLMLNKGRFPGYSRVFSEEVVGLFTSVMVQKKYNNTYARGWETGAGGVGGSKSSKDSFGLGDTSGSYVWADNQKNLAIVMLANGNFPVERAVPTEYLGRLTDAIMKVLGL